MRHAPSFPTLDPSRVETLRARAERLILGQPRLSELRNRLLDLGGQEVVLYFPEFDLPALLERGRDFPTAGLRTRRMANNGCHGNAASLWLRSGGQTKIVTGYGLSEDGLWRQHSWGVRDGRIVETTVSRVGYFGFELTSEEAARFMAAIAGASPTT